MIIQSNRVFQPGDTIQEGWLSDADGNYHAIPFMVVRIATQKEFLDYCDEQKARYPFVSTCFFYEISID